MRTGDVDGAQKDAMDLIEKDPKDGNAWLLLGKTQERKGNLDEAQVSYRQAQASKSDEAQAALSRIRDLRIKPHMDQAEKFISEKNWAGAASELREAISIAPTGPLHRQLSEILKTMGETKEAAREIERAQRLEKGAE